MKERAGAATCNFTLRADGFGDYFVSTRKQMKKKLEGRAFFGVMILLKAPLVPCLCSHSSKSMKTNYLK